MKRFRALTLVAFAAAALALVSAGGASADFTAYNDAGSGDGSLPHMSSGNVTNITTEGKAGQTLSGVLKNYADGASTGVTATASYTGTNSQAYSDSGGTAALYNSGTDAYNTFFGIGDWRGYQVYAGSNWVYKFTFTGLKPYATYEFVTTANRNNSSYVGGSARNSKYTIVGASSFTNSSSGGATQLNGGASTAFNTGYNTVNGYVARWTNIVAVGGTFAVTAEALGSPNTNGYGFSMFMLKEVVPEPASLLALGAGLLGMAGSAIRRRSRA